MESLHDLLRQILFGGSLQDKLAGLGLPPAQWNWNTGWETPFETPENPGRVGVLAARTSSENDRFPRKSDLLGPESFRHRGRILHFFANHELLAIETMAFTLLRFPDAPVEFKQGVFRILQEEQQHLSSYVARMKDYGVEMGEVPLNFYFWNSLKTLASPMDFVTRMSLTFEQANLDFALEYQQIFARELSDAPTAQMLQKVHDDEITHVAHGLYWFNRWRAEGAGQGQSEWESYRRSLPFPMSARRARGGVFFAEESRRRAGFSEDYIENVRITGGSRGRVPDLFYYNPQCELESAGVKLSPAACEKIRDLEPVLFWFAQEDDVVISTREPPREWLKEVFEYRGEIPEWISDASAMERPVQSLQPWGWGKSAFDLQTQLAAHVKKSQTLAPDDFARKFLSKAWWKQQLGTPGRVIHNHGDLAEYIGQSYDAAKWIVKAEHSTSGRGHQVVASAPEAKLSGGACVVEPYYDKQIDFSVQYELGADGKLKSFEPRLFETDSRHQYVKSYLGVHPRDPLKAYQRVLEASRASFAFEQQRAIQILRDHHYVGPVGIDGLIACSAEGGLQVVPIIEVNVRLTMGRLAHEIERTLKRRGVPFAEMRFYTGGEGPEFWVSFAANLKNENGGRVLSVTPPSLAQSTWVAVLY
ncbi:MAG: DUF455 family protein [Bdellovibrionales bacterium]|nr:DUF455 family protein [Bdellovibrionales bacterium]